MTTLFISDLHLEDSEPERTEWLMSFLGGPARRAESVYILGDLFEFWIGDDAISATARRVARETANLASSGVACHFMHGNRDFLLGEAYAAAAGMTLLPETCIVSLHGTATLLLHGDTLCTDDLEYQAFRTQSRNPAWQQAVLAMTIEQRLEMAQNARAASREHTGSATQEIMDVNEQAVAAAFTEHGVNRMIHGHTHRPAHHRYGEGKDEKERIVLADWYQAGSYLAVSPAGTETKTL